MPWEGPSVRRSARLACHSRLGPLGGEADRSPIPHGGGLLPPIGPQLLSGDSGSHLQNRATGPASSKHQTATQQGTPKAPSTAAHRQPFDVPHISVGPWLTSSSRRWLYGGQTSRVRRLGDLSSSRVTACGPPAPHAGRHLVPCAAAADPPTHNRKNFLRKMKFSKEAQNWKPTFGTQTFVWRLTHPPAPQRGGEGGCQQHTV